MAMVSLLQCAVPLGCALLGKVLLLMFIGLMDDLVSNDKLLAYEELLIKFNKKLNLISRESIKNINENHFQDCLNTCKYLKSLDKVDKIYDFGSGNGLPGLIYAISEPTVPVVLVEKDQRKSQFLKHAAGALGADNVSVWSTLAEDIPASTLTGVCRAFLPMGKALPVWDKICDSGSVIYMMKSTGWEQELAGVVHSTWSFVPVHEYTLMNSTITRLIIKATKL